MADYSDAYIPVPEPSREQLEVRIKRLEEARAQSLEDEIRAEIREVLRDTPMPIDFLVPVVQRRLTPGEDTINKVLREMIFEEKEIEEIGVSFVYRVKEKP